MVRRVYLDYNATTPLAKEVLTAMRPYLTREYGNPSSLHQIGQRSKKAIEEARQQIAEILGVVDPKEIIFTGSGSESDNLAIKGLAANFAGGHIITSSIEHHAVLSTVEFLQKQGYSATFLPVDSTGLISVKDLVNHIRPETFLVSIMLANNEVGTIQPVAEIGQLLKEINKERQRQGLGRIYFHTDAVQAAGKLPIKVKELGVDLLSLAAHKFYGPKGVGLLYCRQDVPVTALIHGGSHEYNRRAGTENVSGIVGMAAAWQLVVERMEEENQRLKKLRQLIIDEVKRNIANVRINGHPEKCLSNTLNISFEFIDGEALLLGLDTEGIAVSTGSACASGVPEPSHVLLAMGLKAEVARSAIRISLGHYTSEEDIRYFLKKLAPLVENLRKISPLYSARNPDG